MLDPIGVLAQQRIISLSAELEAGLGQRSGGGIAIEVLRRLRARAADALALLAMVNLDTPEGLTKARSLQNDVQFYDEWVKWLREILQEGRAADAEMKDEERVELVALLTGDGNEAGRREAIELGLLDPNAAQPD